MSPLDEEDNEKVPEVEVDVSGHPILPARPAGAKLQQALVRTIFAKAYCRFNFFFFVNYDILIITSEDHQQ